MGDLWVISGESGLSGHYVFRILDHEPLAAEIDAVEKAFFSAKPGCCPTSHPRGGRHVHFPTGWGGLEVTRLRPATPDEGDPITWTIDPWGN